MGQNRKSLGVDITQPEHLVRVRAHGVTLGWNVLALLAATAAGFFGDVLRDIPVGDRPS